MTLDEQISETVREIRKAAPPETVGQALTRATEKYRNAYDNELVLIEALGNELAASDDDLTERLQRVVDDHARRRCGIADLISKLDDRFGYLPHPGRYVPPYVSVSADEDGRVAHVAMTGDDSMRDLPTTVPFPRFMKEE